MEIPELVLVVIFAVTPVSAHLAPLHFPTDGTGLLEYCGQAAKMPSTIHLRSPPGGQGTLAFKEGWCGGHLQAMRDMVVFWQIQVVKPVGFLNGVPNPSTEMLKELMSKQADYTCIPDEVSLEQMARVLVKWLRDHPERLHERFTFLTLDALHASFPCEGDTGTKKPNA
jgi:hypothetical protein